MAFSYKYYTQELNNPLVKAVKPTSANDDDNPIDLYEDHGIGEDEFGALILVGAESKWIKVGDANNTVVSIGPLLSRDTFNAFYPRYIYYSTDNANADNGPQNVLVTYKRK